MHQRESIMGYLLVAPVVICLLILVIYPFFFAIWIMGTITVTLATRLDMVANLTLCTIIFLLGLMSNYFIGRGAESDSMWRIVYRAIYALLPNWQFFWMADALASKQTIPVSYIAYAFGYMLLYVGFCAIIAIMMFQNREVAQDAIN